MCVCSSVAHPLGSNIVFGSIRPTLARFSPIVARLRPASSIKSGRCLASVCCTESAHKAGLDSAKSGRHRQNFAQCRSADLGPDSAKFERCRPKSAQLRPDFDALNRFIVFKGPECQRISRIGVVVDGGQLWRSTPAFNSVATHVLHARTPGGNADMIGGVDCETRPPELTATPCRCRPLV